MQSFQLKVSAAETAALCRHFDTNFDGMVDGPEFLRGFFKMQQDYHGNKQLRPCLCESRTIQKRIRNYSEKGGVMTIQ